MLPRVGRRMREIRVFAHAMRSAAHPILAQIVPMRPTLEPVPTVEMLQRIDQLGGLRTSMVTLTGAEPTLHPDLDAIIARIRKRGAMATLITNGLSLTPSRIRRLNRVGLDALEIGIDNIPSLRVLDQKLVWLERFAKFRVIVHARLGAGIANPDDAVTIGRRARDLGFNITLGIVHDDSGQLQPLSPDHQRAYEDFGKLGPGGRSDRFEDNIARGVANEWHCRAGGRFLYVCEDGLVHYCSQQRGRPGIRLADYTAEDIRRESAAPKSCAPLCTLSVAHRTAMFDDRERPGLFRIIVAGSQA
jgi:hypothetical protein